MQQSTLICNNFSGINRTSSVFSSNIITASDLQNVELFATETNSGVGIRTASGNVSVSNSLPGGEFVVNIFESIQKSNSYFFVHTETEDEGKIYLFNPTTGVLTLKVSDLSVTGKSSATDVSQGWSDLWVFSNSEEMLSIEIGKLNSDNELEEVKMMTPKDPDNRDVKGLGIVVYSGRLWVFDGQVLWYSAQENIYDFATSDAELVTSAGYIEFVKKITAIYPYLGSLAVFHSNSSCMIMQNESDQSFYKSFDSPGGCAGYNSLVFHGTQLYFYDNTKKGVFSFMQVVNGDKTLGENIALDIQDELFSIRPEVLGNIKTLSVVTSDRNEVWFLIPDTEEEYSKIMIYDYLRKTWVKRKSQKISSIAVVNSKLYSAGKRIYQEYVSNSFDGKFIEAYYKCTPLNMGVENSLKILAYPPKITLNTFYSNNFNVEYTKDYNALTTKRRKIVSKNLKDILYFDKSFWDESTFPPDKINVIKRLPAAYFRTLQMTFYTNNADQNFCINSIEFGRIKSKL